MNFSTLFGFIAAAAVFFAVVIATLDDPMIFVDWHALLIVGGGTGAATLIAYPARQIVTLLHVFVRRMFGGGKRDFTRLIGDICELSKAKLHGDTQFYAAAQKVSDLFLRDAAAMVSWQNEVTKEELREILETRANTHYTEYLAEAKIFKSIARFPPAFGLIGAAIGIMALMQSLGDAESRKNIGPAMAVALVATVYGIGFANLILIPVAENLMRQTREDALARMIVVEGVMLIQSERPTLFISEKLQSFLLPKQRTASVRKPPTSRAA